MIHKSYSTVVPGTKNCQLLLYYSKLSKLLWYSVANYLILLPELKLSPCAQQPMMGDILQVVCSSTCGIFFSYLAHGRWASTH